ncbi:glycosyltransferase family 2 protein [Paenibacillus taiwanensis]|uniref:glycosyltransferase family 2 protein n=1 Tax=Paenibacillus taiwanensis TaxID=401638 RepID=UPI000428D935|nr:hypothetical protein [Paenibacillus taiwanensis]
MNYVLGIFYVNRLDLLYKALYSVQAYWPHVIVIDNSWNKELRSAVAIPKGVTVYEPPIPLSHSQSQNMLHYWGKEQNCDFVMYMHSDAEAESGTPELFLKRLTCLMEDGTKWGAANTYFDTLAAFSMKAIQSVGPWDQNLPMYYSDIDWFRRMRLCHYELIETLLPVKHHNDGASTVKSDVYLLHVHEVTFPLYQDYYIRKWGGGMGQETFSLAFDRFPLNPVPDYLADR